MKTTLSTNGPWYLLVAAALGATCRSYETDPQYGSNSGGSNPGGSGAGESGRGGGGGEAGDHAGDSSGPGNGGRSGNATGGLSGSAGTSDSGASGDGASGDGGAGAGSTDTPEPGILGAVRVLVDGIPKCGGSLLTNDWVLTADQCVASNDPTPLEVGFGMDAERFQQTRSVLEVQRFPGNDGTDGSRGHDLVLLGVDRPFEIDGQTSGYHRPVWAVTPEAALGPHRCVGWDLRVSDRSPTSKVHEETLVPFSFDNQTNNGPRPSGSRLWWFNTSYDPQQGILPMQADVGSACFHTAWGSIYQHTVHTGNPENRRDNRTNDGREAYGIALGDLATRKWLSEALFDSVVEEIELVGDPGVCSSDPDRIELFGLMSDGNIAWYTWDGSFTLRARFLPPTDTSFLSDSPGAYCTNGGSIELFVTGRDGAIWWRRMDPDGMWNDQWARVPDVRSLVDSGIAVSGLADHFYVFARAASGELRYAEYDSGWTGTWFDMADLLVLGTPTALMTQEGRIDVYVRDTQELVRQRWMHNGNWVEPWNYMQGRALSDPTVVSWNNSHLDVITRSTSNTVGHAMFQVHSTEPLVTNTPMPFGGNPAAVARQPGTTDVFVTQSDGLVWHGFWPRKPKPR